LQARVGVHVGPVVGGVIGSRRLAYDYWGDTMNVAARLQGAAPPNGIAVSEATWLQVGGALDFEARTIVLKGIGETEVYLAALAPAPSPGPAGRS
jgi:class 3 adenylate cyclase